MVLRYYIFIVVAYVVVLGTLMIVFGESINQLSFLSILPCWLITNAMDCHSTIIFMRLKTPLVQEMNLIVVFFIEKLGVIKGVLAHRIIFLFLFSSLFISAPLVLMTISIILFLVSMNNYRLYFKAKRMIALDE